MIIRYEFASGNPVEIEVEERIGEVIIEIEKTDFNKNRAETRRHSSMERMEEEEHAQFSDENQDVEKRVEAILQNERLYSAIHQLAPEQQRLVRSVYFEDQSLTEIARSGGVSVAAISNRLNKIQKRLKKILE